MKKILSFMLVFVLVLSLSITAFAAEDTNTGSITISNATKNEKYSVYKLFDATHDGDAVSYTIDKGNQFFPVLFGEDGTTSNKFFVCTLISGTRYGVDKRASVNDTELIAYVTNIINAEGTNYKSAADPITASSTQVTFSGLDFGYYIIKSTLGTTVTINSNTPDVTVIDKNQQGATNFIKYVKNGDNWEKSNSACFGETVEYKMTFKATNYDGANQVQFYSVYDTTGKAITPNFETITVKVGTKELTKGYFLNLGHYGVGNGAIGEWDGKNYETKADWYLVWTNENDFRISIPWMTNHTLNSVTTAEDGSSVQGYSLTFGADATSKFDSPVDVEITYQAKVEEDATIGGASYNTAGSNNTNTAHAKLYFQGGTDSTLNDTVHTYVYGIGILKEDSTTLANLDGAEFEVYKDQACTDMVTFEPTSIDGVYTHDEDSTTNKVVSPINGKIVLLGLKAGDYYLKEVKAPDGYNALSAPVKVEVREGKSEDFSVFAKDGEVADTEQDMAGYTKHTYGVTKVTVGNSQGRELPSTGGKGATMLITFGSLIAICFAVFLITHKKMSIYTD